MSTPLPSPPRPPRPASVPAADTGTDTGPPTAPPEPAALPRPPAAPRRRADAVTAYGNIVRARVVALGGLTALIAAVAYIVLSTGGAPNPPLAPVAARVGAARHARYWIVRPGQTLSSIAARESTSAVALEHLNPHLIPGTLIAGQRVLLPG